MTEPLNLDEITAEWLNVCGPHDYGVTGSVGCFCPDGDPRPVISRLVAELEQARAALARVEALCADPAKEVPPDGSMVLAHYRGGHQNIDVERAWCRTDEAIDKPPHPDGDWWILGKDHKGRHQWGEVLWLDDPACDRGTVSLEVLVSVEDIVRALNPQDGA